MTKERRLGFKHKNIKFSCIFNYIKTRFFFCIEERRNECSGIDVEDLLDHWPEVTEINGRAENRRTGKPKFKIKLEKDCFPRVKYIGGQKKTRSSSLKI